MGLTSRQLIRKNRHKLQAVQSETDTKADGGLLDNHIADTGNPHAVTKAQLGLGTMADEDADEVGVDIEFALAKGVILKSPDESRFKLEVDNAGGLIITAL